MTAKGKVNKIITELAVIEVRNDGLHLTEISEGTAVEEVIALTQAPLIVEKELKTF